MVKVKNKKRNLSETTAKKRDQSKKKSLNAFEVHINKEKHKVLGRKNKTDRGLPGVSRAKAINKRKNTLLHEYKVRDKNNTFLDRRIGEKNSAMTQEDKVMARFAAERVKAHKKKNIFNLNDEEILTHRGQTLEEIEKFDDPRSDDEEYSDDDNKTGKLDKDFVSEAHFGGGVLSRNSDSAMSRKDLIEQLIAESKKRKAEKQKIREQTLDLTEKLDTEWKDLLPIVNAAKKQLQDIQEKPKTDDYDIALRELKFEARGTPSDRLKSEEEIAKEEKEKLETLEADRLARMKGFTGETNDNNKHKSADDLDDGFFIEDVNEDTLTYGEDGMPKDNSNKRGKENGNVNDEDASIAGSGSDESDDAESEEEEEMETESEKIAVESQDDYDNLIKQFSTNLSSKSHDPYDNIPVLKISDDVPASEAKSNKKVNVVVPDKKETSLTKKADVEDDAEIESSEAETESEDEEEEEGENSDDDNLSDLKEDDSSSEEDEPSAKKNVKFSSTLEKTATPSGKQDALPSKSILKSVKDEPSAEEKLSAEERSAQIKADLLKRKEVMEKARQELPYTYSAPESFEELEELLQPHNADYQSVIVERIIKCNHQSLGESNKEKLANLFQFLIQHVDKHAAEADENDVVNCFQIFDRYKDCKRLNRIVVSDSLKDLFRYRLCPHLYDLAQANAVNAKTCIQELMKEKHEKFESRQKKYPGIDTVRNKFDLRIEYWYHFNRFLPTFQLLLFKLVSLLFPTSDYRHPVVTPAVVFMSQILLRCRVRTRSDVSKGLFICTLVLEVIITFNLCSFLSDKDIIQRIFFYFQYTLLSKRFSPSTINFLRGIIHMSTPKPPVQTIKAIPPFKSTGELSNLLIPDTDRSEMKINTKSNLMAAADLITNEMDDDFRVKAFITAVNLASEFKNQLEELEAVFPIFEPIVRLLSINKLINYPENVKQHVGNVLDDLNTLKDKKLEYITREKKKPKALRLYEPRIETVYVSYLKILMIHRTLFARFLVLKRDYVFSDTMARSTDQCPRRKPRGKNCYTNTRGKSKALYEKSGEIDLSLLKYRSNNKSKGEKIRSNHSS